MLRNKKLMDDKIYNYKEKGNNFQNNQLNMKRTRNSFKNDIINCKTSSQKTNMSLKIKTNKLKELNKYNSSNYKTLNQFRANKSKPKEKQLNNVFLKTNLNNNINTTRSINKLKHSKIKTKILLTEPNKKKTPSSNLKFQHKINNLKSKNNIKKNIDLPMITDINTENKRKNENFILFVDNSEINIEYEKLKKIWEETGVTKTFIKNFEIINNKNINNDNLEEVLQIIKAEIFQMNQFKNDLMKSLKLVEKREEEIKNLKNLDKKYSNLNIYLNFEDESDANNMLHDKDIMMNKNELENEIHKSLSALRFKGINVVSQIRKLKMKYSHFLNIGKIDINYLTEKYGYDKNYLIKLITDLDFLKDSNIKNLYNFSHKGQDPFLLNLSSKMPNSDLISSFMSKETQNDFFSELEDYELNSKNYNNIDDSNKNIIINGKKYKTLPMTKEVWEIIKKLMYYLSEEILFNMVKLEKEEKNNLITNNINNENNTLNQSPSLIEKNNVNEIKNINNNVKNTQVNQINPSKVISNLKLSDINKYNQLFFNKTITNSKSNNERRLLKRNENKNIFLKLNKDIEFIEKKLRGVKNDDLDDDNNEKDFIDIFKILHKKPKSKEINLVSQNVKPFPKIGSNKTLKKLVIRTNTADYFKEPKPEPKEESKKKSKRYSKIVEDKLQSKRKKEESIINEVESRLKLEIDKRIKSIEDSITNELKEKMEINKKRLEEKSKLIEEEKKKLETFLENQKNLRIIEEQKREKLALDRQVELEKEQIKRKEKKKEMDLMNQKMKEEIEDKIMKEIDKKFKEQEEIIKKKEIEEKQKREEKEKEIEQRMKEEEKKKEQVEKNMEELLIRIRKEEIERIKEEEINKMRDEENAKIINTKLDYLVHDDKYKNKLVELKKDINKEMIKGQKLDKKINDPQKVKEIKDLIYKETNENNDINNAQLILEEDDMNNIDKDKKGENNNLEKNNTLKGKSQNEEINNLLNNSIKLDESKQNENENNMNNHVENKEQNNSKNEQLAQENKNINNYEDNLSINKENSNQLDKNESAKNELFENNLSNSKSIKKEGMEENKNENEINKEELKNLSENKNDSKEKQKEQIIENIKDETLSNEEDKKQKENEEENEENQISKDFNMNENDIDIKEIKVEHKEIENEQNEVINKENKQNNLSEKEEEKNNTINEESNEELENIKLKKNKEYNDEIKENELENKKINDDEIIDNADKTSNNMLKNNNNIQKNENNIYNEPIENVESNIVSDKKSEIKEIKSNDIIKDNSDKEE